MKQDDEWDYGPFKVGDVVEGHNMILNPEYNGMSCIIQFGLEQRRSFHKITGESYDSVYGVEWDNGVKSSIFPKHLRRRKPPMTGLSGVLAMFDKQPDRVKELA